MKLKCKKILTGLCLAGLFTLSGCFPEGVDGCPEDMHLSFYLDDKYEPGDDYDSRVGNDVYLYIFLDQHLLTSFEIPYEDIRSHRQYVYAKFDGLEGNLDLVGWAVARNAPGTDIPDMSGGGTAIELKPDGSGRYRPASTDLYMGSINAYEKVDEPSYHDIGMGVSTCRVEINITDYSNIMGTASGAFVEVNGTMSQMTMRKTGTGMPAVVLAELECVDTQGQIWQTGRFGVLPSSEGQTVSVDIYADAELVQTLEIPRESLPTGAEAGGLIIFDYIIGQAHYFLTIDGFTEKIEIVDEM